MKDERIHYLSVSLGYRLWDKEKTKLAIATEMVREAMSVLSSDRQIFLLCDSWYPKAEVAGLVDEFDNLDIICNARIDTVMYDLPPARTGKRGRPRKHGDRVLPEQFSMSCPKTGSWKVGIRAVLTKLWGWNRIVYAIVTCKLVLLSLLYKKSITRKNKDFIKKENAFCIAIPPANTLFLFGGHSP